MYLNVGNSSTTDAASHAPGSPKQSAAKDAVDADAVIGAPLTIAGRKQHIRILAPSSAMPAPRTYHGLNMPCTALLVTTRNPRIK